jgi:hypothetical protein
MLDKIMGLGQNGDGLIWRTLGWTALGTSLSTPGPEEGMTFPLRAGRTSARKSSRPLLRFQDSKAWVSAARA